MSENEFEIVAAEPDDDSAPVIPEAEDEAEAAEVAIGEAELRAEIDGLQKELNAAKIRVELLLSGILREKLDEGAAIAAGLCAAGKSPEAAAEEVANEYPHLKAVRQEIPQFAAGGSGSADGFSAIRKIFSGR